MAPDWWTFRFHGQTGNIAITSKYINLLVFFSVFSLLFRKTPIHVQNLFQNQILSSLNWSIYIFTQIIHISPMEKWQGEQRRSCIQRPGGALLPYTLIKVLRARLTKALAHAKPFSTRKNNSTTKLWCETNSMTNHSPCYWFCVRKKVSHMRKVPVNQALNLYCFSKYTVHTICKNASHPGQEAAAKWTIQKSYLLGKCCIQMETQLQGALQILWIKNIPSL